ncbi:MAG: efflux RND transporter permease subunit [Acidobacteria bacterium]|nr:MAG: efflux RND transporter permease subunit [Acidobacteriota bacterium]
MKGAIAWFANNAVAANVLMVVILIAGASSLMNMKQEVFPEVDLDLIAVSVDYLGAAPEEVEQAVCVRIEEAIQGIDGIKKITSSAREGKGTVVAHLATGANSSRVLDEIKSRVDAIDTFPEETEKPIIREVTNKRQVIDLAVWGEVDRKVLKVLAEGLRDDLAALPGITIVELSNAPPYEISIEVPESSLRRHGLTFDEVAQAVRRSSVDLPGGSIKTEGGEILLRTSGEAEVARQFEELVLRTRRDGTRLRLGDVAHVIDGFAETDQFSRFDGKPAIQLQVFRTGDQGALKIVTQVNEFIENNEGRLPEGVHLTTWQNQAKVLRDRLDLLIRNGIAGLILVFISLALFLRFRLAFWVSMGIPLSFLGAAWMMPWLGVSVNLISLFAFIVVLGIVVDDAIVAAENIYTQQQRHGDGLRGAIEGTQEISMPVIFAVLTTVAAFSPLMMADGIIGKIMRVIPLVVIPCLLFSLVESLFILPAHLRHMEKNGERRKGPWLRFQSLFSEGLLWVAHHVYRPTLDRGLRYRYVTLALGLAVLLLTASFVAGGWIRFTFFPDVEADYISATLTMPQGTPASVTSEKLRHFEASAEHVRRETIDATGEDPFQHLVTSIGSQPYTTLQRQNGGRMVGLRSAGHLGEVVIELLPGEERSSSSEELMQRWRETTEAIPDAVEVVFSASMFSAGDDVDIQLTGSDIGDLRAAAAAVKTRLAEYPNVYEISDSFREGKKQIEMDIRPKAEALGLTLSDLARQVRQAFYGEEAQRIVRGREDIRVMVRYPKSERRSLGNLDELRIRTPEGAEVAFADVATVRHGRGFATITRVDRRRSVNVTADVNDQEGATAIEILTAMEAGVLPEILSEYPGVAYSLEGQSAEQRDTMTSLINGFVIAAVVIFALLAVPLRSYMQPLIIMLAIPFGLVGAVWGHVIMGMDLTIMTMFGIVALSGVVVNDSLVMVDFINRYRTQAGSLFEAIRDAGVQRFRPIMLTSLTTFLGLTPLMLEKSMQARFLIPMAVALAFGVVFSTVISLIIVPCVYLILTDVKRGMRVVLNMDRSREQPMEQDDTEELEPAAAS